MLSGKYYLTNRVQIKTRQVQYSQIKFVRTRQTSINKGIKRD